jgi:catechol 2,3-dioxygenase-like lactoylglutathione lyase family enzyme
VTRFSGICIITQDVARLRDFYRAVLQVGAEGDDTFTAFSIDGAELSLFVAQGMEQMAPGSMTGAGHGGCALEFEVEDVDREYARLTEMSVPIVKLPMTHPWGRRSVWFRDPDGNIVDFYARVDR